jgi:hypothetical protein
MRDQLLPRTTLPRPELFEEQRKPLPGVVPGGKAAPEQKNASAVKFNRSRQQVSGLRMMP